MAIITTTTKKLLNLKKRIKVIQGGTSAGKTFSIEQILIDKAQSNPGLTIDTIAMTVPHLKDGAIKDFQTIMQDHQYWNDKQWNGGDKVYTFPGTGSTKKFKSVDKLGKAKGPRRDILFLNEANEMPWEIVDQLMARTRGDIWIDYNPSSEFWYHNEILAKGIDHDFIIVNHMDNEALDENTLNYILGKKPNKNWWKVYGLGELGDIEGRIFTGWNIIDEIPHEARLERYGTDFGYTNDPTAIIAIYKYNGGIILDEKLYQKGLLNKQIADNILNFDEKALIVADSSEPKSIDEIKLFGINIIGAEKGKGSVNHGIDLMQEQRISVTKSSINLIKEYKNYMWATDRLGKSLNVPEDVNNHALDAARYGIQSLFRVRRDTTSQYQPQVRPVFSEIGI